MGHIDAKKKSKEEAIYQESFQLFVKKGFDKTTIADIAKASGLAKGTFYLYFSDKYELRDKLIARASRKLLDRAWDRLVEEQTDGFYDQTVRFVDIILDYFEENPMVLLFIEKNLSMGILQETLVEGDSGQEGRFLSRLSGMLKAEGLRAEHPELLGFMILELANATGYSCILDENPIPLAEYRPYLHACIRRIIDVCTESDD